MSTESPFGEKEMQGSTKRRSLFPPPPSNPKLEAFLKERNAQRDAELRSKGLTVKVEIPKSTQRAFQRDLDLGQHANDTFNEQGRPMKGTD